jgi:hypothetical protein
LALLSPRPVAAQVVRGRVLEASTSQPIRAASLELLDDRQQVLVRVTTDSTGLFRLRGWLAGKYQVRAGALGYETVSSDVLELGTGEEFALDIRLAPNAIPIDAITVVSRSTSSLKEVALRGYYDRRDSGRRIGMGRFLDRGEIEERGTRLSDVLRRVPGLRVLYYGSCVIVATSTNPSGTLRPPGSNMGGCPVPARVCPANIYLDGMLITADGPVSIDQTIPLDWVEAVEAYRRPAELPAEFLGSGACGVVAIWTRRG